MSTVLVYLRSTVFAIAQALLTVVFAVLGLLTYPCPPLFRYRVISTWSRIVLMLARVVCGVRYQVLGAEQLSGTPSLVLSKHQSAWETLAFQAILPPQVWVLKRELLRIPFFGWGLAMTSPIAIDRSAGMRALKMMLEQGKDRIAKGFWIVMFPEGTRVAPGQRGHYHIGGAWLATQLGVPVIPVAHNAGTLWPKGAFLKHPGLITVSLAPPLDVRGLKADAVNRQVEAWIEAEVERIGSARR